MGDELKKKETGDVFGTYGKRIGTYSGLWENLRERDNFKDLDVDGRIILKWIFKK